MQPKGYYNWKLWFLLTAINCSLIIAKWPFNGWMTATVVAKLTQILWKKGWLQLLLEKANNLNKKMEPAIPGIKHSNLQREKYFLGTTTTWINAVFYNLLFRLVFFAHLLIIPTICYFTFYQLIGWENFHLSCHWSKSKDEKKFYLELI